MIETMQEKGDRIRRQMRDAMVEEEKRLLSRDFKPTGRMGGIAQYLTKAEIKECVDEPT